MFANFNRSVRSLALDMKQPESVDLVLRLASVADVVLENFGPDVLERWGIGYEKIAAVNPRIVMLSQTGFGHTGPRSHYLAYGATIFSFIGTHPDLGPVPRHAPATTPPRPTGCSPSWPRSRRVTGPGWAPTSTRPRSRWPGRSWARCCWTTGQRARTRRGPAARHGGPLPAATTRWLAVEPEDDDDWQRLARLAGAPDPGDHAAVTDAVGTWAAALTPQQAMRMLQRAGLAAGAVQDNEDVTRDPQHRERHFLQEMDHPDLGVAEYAGPPYRLSKTPGHHPAADPAARGAHHRDPGRVAGHAARGKPDVRLAAAIPIRRAAVSRTRPFLVRWFQTRTLTPFAIYCLAFGALSIIRFL